MFNLYTIAAIVAIAAMATLYALVFFGRIVFGVTDQFAFLGQFGDYMGGTLNPTLSFISIILLIKSLNFQNQANLDLREELNNGKRTEKLRSFSELFFRMINSQKELLHSLELNLIVGTCTVAPGAATVIYIEDEIARLRANDADTGDIADYLEEIDVHDRIFGILRAFYITVKIVSEKLSDMNGFSLDDRREYFLTLINFTDFSQLRLIIIALQFTDYQAASYLRDNVEFISVLSEVNLSVDAY